MFTCLCDDSPMTATEKDLRDEMHEAERLAAALPGAARKPRTGRLFAEITNAEGLTFRYRVLPLPHLADCLRAYRLVLLAADGRELARHLCRLQEGGVATCSCTGPYAVECEHLSFLQACGLLDIELLNRLWEAVHTAEAHERDLAEQVRAVAERQAQLAAALSAAPKPRKPRKQKAA
jgi:hypothetical protein